MPVPPHFMPPPGPPAPSERGVYKRRWTVSPETWVFHFVFSTGRRAEWYVSQEDLAMAERNAELFIQAMDPIDEQPARHIWLVR